MKKEDLPSDFAEKLITIGSKVMIIDGSYMIKEDRIDENDPLAINNDGNPIGHSEDVFEVLDINKPFPTRYMGSDWLEYHNNCKIKNTRTGEIWYCSKINIKNTESVFSKDKGDSL